MTYDL